MAEVEHIAVQILPDGRMDTRNAARYLGIAAHTLANMRCQGTGPAFIRLCNRIFYYRTVLDAWIAEAPVAISTAQSRLGAS